MLEEVWSWGQTYPPAAAAAAPLWPAWDEEDADGLTPLHVAALADRGRGIVAGLLQRCAKARAAWDTPARGKRFSPAQVSGFVAVHCACLWLLVPAFLYQEWYLRLHPSPDSLARSWPPSFPFGCRCCILMPHVDMCVRDH